MKWARAYQRKISTEFRYTAFRPSDVGGDWLEILETEDPLPLLAYQSPTKAHLKAKLTGNRLVIQAKNVKRLAVHIPFAWIQLKELEIRVGRTQSKATIKPSWRTLLERLYKTGDRENLTAETRVINY